MSASAEDVDVVVPKQSCPKRMMAAPGRFITGVKNLDWHFVWKAIGATFIYWGVSFGYFMIFLSWLYADYKSQRIFNLCFFFVSLAIVVTIVRHFHMRSFEFSSLKNRIKFCSLRSQNLFFDENRLCGSSTSDLWMVQRAKQSRLLL